MTHKDIFKGSTYKSLQEQVGGKHYSSMKIQPAEFINGGRSPPVLQMVREAQPPGVAGGFGGAPGPPI